jgi:hypothetical protein
MFTNTHNKSLPFPCKISTLAINTVAICFLAAVSGLAQQPPALQISSPANGSIVNPGQTLSVTVTSPNGTTFSQVALAGPNPIGFNVVATSVPAQFSIAIPSDADCRVYRLTADGVSTSGQGVTSASIQIDVERSDVPVFLSASDSGLVLESQGEQSHLVILADFSDGSTVDVTNSTLVSYASSNTAVATVDASGTVTAQASGNAVINATYTVGANTLQVSIPVTVQHAMMIASPSALTFPSQGVGTTGSAQQLTLTNVSAGTLSVLNLVAGGDFSETDNCIALSPLVTNASCAVNVSFSPTAIGSRSANITVSDSANTAPILIPLTGTGSAAPPPSITSLSPTSGSVGTSVTITGTNFGPTQGTSTVTFNGAAAMPTSWSATSILAPAPSGATTGNVVVAVGGTASNGANFTVQGTTSGIAFVQRAGTDAGTTTSYSLAFDSNNAAGNWIGVCVRAGRTGETFTVTDSRGNTYHQAAQLNITVDTPNGDTLAIFYAENISAGANTITVSDTISGTLRIAILEYTGVATANSLDVTSSGQGTSASPNSGNATTTASGDLLLGAIATADPDTFTAPSGIGIRVFVPGEPSTKLIAEDQIQTAAGSAAASASLNEQDPWGAVLATFKKAHP